MCSSYSNYNNNNNSQLLCAVLLARYLAALTFNVRSLGIFFFVRPTHFTFNSFNLFIFSFQFARCARVSDFRFNLNELCMLPGGSCLMFRCISCPRAVCRKPCFVQSMARRRCRHPWSFFSWFFEILLLYYFVNINSDQIFYIRAHSKRCDLCDFCVLARPCCNANIDANFFAHVHIFQVRSHVMCAACGGEKWVASTPSKYHRTRYTNELWLKSCIPLLRASSIRVLHGKWKLLIRMENGVRKKFNLTDVIHHTLASSAHSNRTVHTHTHRETKYKNERTTNKRKCKWHASSLCHISRCAFA